MDHGTWLVSKRQKAKGQWESITQDMACWKVVVSIAGEHSTWLVGRLVGRSNHGNHGTKSILGNSRSRGHRGPPVVILGKTSETMVIMGNRVGTTVTMGKKGRSYVQSMARGPFWA